ncbi:helix-turn-helix domain-containing protein [Bdellovibrionota bacterium FG-2]
MADESSLSLGEFLRTERERCGITIEQVASATKIGVKTLHALEADDYTDLPAKPFVRGFVTSYVRFIGLEPQEVLTRFGDFIGLKAKNRPSRESGHSGYAFERRDGDQGRTMLWLTLGGFVLIGGLVIGILKPTLKHRRGSHAEKVSSVAVPVGLASPAPSAFPSVSPSAAPSLLPLVSEVLAPVVVPSSLPASLPLVFPLVPSPKPRPLPAAEGLKRAEKDPLNSGLPLKIQEIKHKVVIRAQDDIWVRYKVDARPMMRFILRKGRILVLRAAEKVFFQTSRPGVVLFSHNNGPNKSLSDAKLPISPSQDPTLVFPPEEAKNLQNIFNTEKALRGAQVPLPRPIASSSPEID